MDCSPWSLKKLDTTGEEAFTFSFLLGKGLLTSGTVKGTGLQLCALQGERNTSRTLVNSRSF